MLQWQSSIANVTTVILVGLSFSKNFIFIFIALNMTYSLFILFIFRDEPLTATESTDHIFAAAKIGFSENAKMNGLYILIKAMKMKIKFFEKDSPTQITAAALAMLDCHCNIHYLVHLHGTWIVNACVDFSKWITLRINMDWSCVIKDDYNTNCSKCK